jgi:ABC-type branched-subunit amino acid transport system ATPase component
MSPGTPVPAEPLLEVTGLSKSFGGLRAARDVAISVAPGQIAAIIGPNGAGKSTAFNMIAGALKPDGGRIRFMGRDVRGWRPEQMARLGLARTFQNVRVLPGLDVEENVLVALGQFARTGLLAVGLRTPAFRRERRAFDERVEEILEFVGLQAHRKVLASSLSYGRRKVLEFAMAVATEPALLLLDEPAAGLNQTEKRELAGLIQSVNATGVAVLLIEHDVTFVGSLADQVVVLNFGEVVTTGTPAEVLNDPTVISVYLGENP